MRLKRRMFVATAERVDTSQLQLELAELLAKLDYKKMKALGAERSWASPFSRIRT